MRERQMRLHGAEHSHRSAEYAGFSTRTRPLRHLGEYGTVPGATAEEYAGVPRQAQDRRAHQRPALATAFVAQDVGQREAVARIEHDVGAGAPSRRIFRRHPFGRRLDGNVWVEGRNASGRGKRLWDTDIAH
jgi:hypothetical protein